MNLTNQRSDEHRHTLSGDQPFIGRKRSRNNSVDLLFTDNRFRPQQEEQKLEEPFYDSPSDSLQLPAQIYEADHRLSLYDHPIGAPNVD